MRTRGSFVLLVALALSARGRAEEPLRVLFIGNSYTQSFQVPKMVSDLVRADKVRPIETGQRTPGGKSFKDHFEDGKGVPMIQSKKWDAVVLQDHSLGAISGRDNMFAFGKKLDAEIKKQGARTILFMTWARQHTPQTQEKIAEAYQTLGKELGADVAPVGLAWQEAFRADPKLVLHLDDKSHPNKTGTYLAACVLFSTLYQKSAEGLPGLKGMDEAQVRMLQQIAWKTVQAQKAGAKR